MKYADVVNLVKSDLEIALGCTEPVAVILAVAKARETLGAVPDSVKLWVSGNLYKNGKGVGIPYTSMHGLDIAAAIGVFFGNSQDKLAILKNVTDEHVKLAKQAVCDKRISIAIKDGVDNLYVEVIASTAQNTARVIIEKRHSFIRSVFLNEQSVEENIYDAHTFLPAEHHHIFDELGEAAGAVSNSLSVSQIYECACRVPLPEIEFLEKSVELNVAISDEGLSGDYGLRVGKRLMRRAGQGTLPDDLMSRVMSRAAAGSDARMGGCGFPVMTNSGSGNQGITITLPIVETAQFTGAEREAFLRALFLGHAIPIYIKKRIGHLSALCGVIAASIGAGAGMMFLMNAQLSQILRFIQYMFADLSGMICDGAKPSCALKIATCAGAATRWALLAFDEDIVPGDGIVDDDIEESIKNFSKLGVVGMSNVDALLLEVLKERECD